MKKIFLILLFSLISLLSISAEPNWKEESRKRIRTLVGDVHYWKKAAYFNKKEKKLFPPEYKVILNIYIEENNSFYTYEEEQFQIYDRMKMRNSVEVEFDLVTYYKPETDERKQILENINILIN